MNVTPRDVHLLRPRRPADLVAIPPSPVRYGTRPGILEAWKEWARKGAPSERRLEALSAVRTCIDHGYGSLDLSFFGLTDVPERFPLHISKLDVSSNSLRVLPAELPLFLRELTAENNKLYRLPTRLPDSLETLSAPGNRLESLPPLPTRLTYLRVSQNKIAKLPALPEGLKTVLVDGNNLAALPDRLPASLRLLDASSNRLIALPQQLPRGLERLQVEVNQLEQLPAELPDSLKVITADLNKIRALPKKLPLALEHLFVRSNRIVTVAANFPPNLKNGIFTDNRIHELPAEIFATRLETLLHFGENPLPYETRFQLSKRTFEAKAAAQRAVLQRRNAAALVEAVCFWFPPTEHATVSKVWEKIAAENGAQQFAIFLKRLSQMPSMAHADCKAEVASWLSGLPSSESTRQATFLVALDATETCEDRAALAFNHMWVAGFSSRAQEGAYDKIISEFVSGARVIFRRELLAKKAGEKIRQIRREAPDIDEISVYLGYEVKLNEDLELESPLRTMRFFDLGRISEEDMVAVWFDVMAQENAQFASWLACWSPWESMLERQDPEGYETMRENLHEAIAGPPFQQLLAVALDVLGLADDEDARRICGPTVLKEIERDIKLKFTRDFLTKENQLPLLSPFWSEVGVSFEALRKRTNIGAILDRQTE
jgi:E3 ubiquitin-protein ligase SlrP